MQPAFADCFRRPRIPDTNPEPFAASHTACNGETGARPFSSQYSCSRESSRGMDGDLTFSLSRVTLRVAWLSKDANQYLTRWKLLQDHFRITNFLSNLVIQQFDIFVPFKIFFAGRIGPLYGPSDFLITNSRLLHSLLLKNGTKPYNCLCRLRECDILGFS